MIKILILLLLMISSSAFSFSYRFSFFNSYVNASGGSITYTDSNGLNPRSSVHYPNGYTVHTYTSSGTFQLNSTNVTLNYLIVGGARSGGNGSGSSGGFGVISSISGVNVCYGGEDLK